MAAISWPIHWLDVVSAAHLIEPMLDLGGLGGALFAGEFDASFDLAKGHAGEMEGSSVNAVEPGDPSLQARGATSLVTVNREVIAAFPDVARPLESCTA